MGFHLIGKGGTSYLEIIYECLKSCILGFKKNSQKSIGDSILFSSVSSLRATIFTHDLVRMLM